MQSVKRLDANLLVALKVLLEERHVTRAAERLYLSQPAMSASLQRLRRHFDDPLLVRSGRNMQLTSLGQMLLPLVLEAVRGLERVEQAGHRFVPETADRQFTIRASIYAAAVLAEWFVPQVTLAAPQVQVDFQPLIGSAGDRWSLLREVDVVVMPSGIGMGGREEEVFRDEFQCFLRADHPLLSRGMDSHEILAAAPHAAVRLDGSDSMLGQVTLPYKLLKSLGISARSAVRVPDFGHLGPILRRSDLVALAPSRLTQTGLLGNGVLGISVPGAHEHPLVETAYWHPNREVDSGIKWLVQAMKEPDKTTESLFD